MPSSVWDILKCYSNRSWSIHKIDHLIKTVVSTIQVSLIRIDYLIKKVINTILQVSSITLFFYFFYQLVNLTLGPTSIGIKLGMFHILLGAWGRVHFEWLGFSIGGPRCGVPLMVSKYSDGLHGGGDRDELVPPVPVRAACARSVRPCWF